MAFTIVFTNQKGGVGKTTSSSTLAVGLSKMGKRVLSVDLDPQGNLGFSLGIDIEKGLTAYELLRGEVTAKQAIRKTEDYGDVITSNILLSEMGSFSGEGVQLLLKNALKEVKSDYDFIVIDTPPALNILTINAYAAADYLIIPMAAEILSLVGLVQLKETVEVVKTTVNPNLQVLGILLTRFNRRTNLGKDVAEMAETVAGQLGTVIFDSKIRNGVAASEAPAHGANILDYAPKSNPAKDYSEFIEEVVTRIR